MHDGDSTRAAQIENVIVQGPFGPAKDRVARAIRGIAYDDGVIARAARQEIGPGPAKDQIIAIFAKDVVIAVAAIKRVVILTTAQRIVTIAAID